MSRENFIIGKIDRAAAKAHRELRDLPEYGEAVAAVARYARAAGAGEAWALCCRLTKAHQHLTLRSGRERADAEWAKQQRGRQAVEAAE